MRIACAPMILLLVSAHPPTSDLVATIETGSAGNATVCLWSNKTDFPNCQKGKSFKKLVVPVKQGRTQVRFEAVPEGNYAISIALDANANGKIDTNLIGIPREPFGVSGARSVFGRPSYGASQFKHPAPSVIVTLSR